MSFEDRIRASVDQALGTLIKQVTDHAAVEREAAMKLARDAAMTEAEQVRAVAVQAARESAFADAEQAAQARIADAEARVRAEMEQASAAARAEEQEIAARSIRRAVDAGVEARIAEALEATETRMKLALADAELRAADAVKEAVAAARAKERDAEMAGVTRLLESIRGLDGATSLSEVLDALALAAAREAARAAVVVLRGDRVQGWKMSGFGPRDNQPKSIDLLLSESGVIGMAVGAARAVTTKDSQSAAAGPGFEKLPDDRMGMAVPVIVGGRVVAVLYADGVNFNGHERSVPSGWPELIEVLARHAGRCLEALTTQRAATPPRIQPQSATGTPGTATGASGPANPPTTMSQIAEGVAESAMRTARLLVSEIRLFHEPAVHQGRQERNLLVRLAPEIEKARKAYNEQVPVGVRGHTDYFQQELIRTLAGGDATLLGNMA